MKQGCKYCQFNKYDGIHLASNICSVDATHINPYSEGYCDDFKPKDDITEECKCNTCKYREVTKIICPCIDCYDYSHYQEKGKDNNEEMGDFKDLVNEFITEQLK